MNKNRDRGLNVFVIVTVCLVVLLGFMIGYRFFTENNVSSSKQAVTYVHDKRTGLCFAVWKNRAITVVSCKKVEKELSHAQQR
jgi:hypothetical protein